MGPYWTIVERHLGRVNALVETRESGLAQELLPTGRQSLVVYAGAGTREQVPWHVAVWGHWAKDAAPTLTVREEQRSTYR